jgi:hypothetical protein
MGCGLYDSIPDRPQDGRAEPVPKCQAVVTSGQAMVAYSRMLAIDRYRSGPWMTHPSFPRLWIREYAIAGTWGLT